MNYVVKVIYGASVDVVDVPNVSALALNEGVYFLYNSENEVVFTSSKEYVIYIKEQ